MATISAKKSDFDVLATAARRAKDAGCLEDARALDLLARKVNAAVTNNDFSKEYSGIPRTTSISYKDVPSTLIEGL